MRKFILLNMQFGDLTLDQKNCFVIGEIGLNHNGSVELAEKMVYESLIAGATLVKFQKRTPSVLARAEYLDQPFVKAPSMGTTQREVRERHELRCALRGGQGRFGPRRGASGHRDLLG